ncbi:MAG: M23 family metallopeptidase [Ruminococcaceae bacterium]|nr:M23 family metallopeptidase [Oscillospiraceae bacterium]
MMKRSERISLDSISGIDEKYINEATEERIKYIMLLKKRGFFYYHKGITAIAACFALLITSVFAVIMFAGKKEVPVYTGMTVASIPSDTAEMPESLNATLTASTVNSNVKFVYKPVVINAEKSLNAAIKERYGFTEGVVYDYYAKPGEEILITVHIDNPDNFEILSFTLNGEKYSSYMFEEGSDMEHIVLRTNVGTAQNIVSYTIDAIKYVDGKDIKDVKMEGEQTVNVAVGTTRTPKGVVNIKSYSYNSIVLNAQVEDVAGLIEKSGGSAYVIVYDRKNGIVADKKISVGEPQNGILIEGLVGGKEYKCAVVAVYDALDSNGKYGRVLSQKDISLDPEIFVDTNINVQGDTVRFDLARYNSISELEKVELIDERGNVVFTLTGEDVSALSFSGMKAGVYSIRVTYKFDNGTYTERKSNTTPAFNCIAGILPVDGEVILGYSDFTDVYGTITAHYAIDFKPTGEDKRVYSVSKGTVTSIRDGRVEVTDSLGYIYCYDSLGEVRVAFGDNVSMGTVIGTVGTSFEHESSAGEHLHFSLRDPNYGSGSNRAIDPKFYTAPTAGEILTPYSEAPIYNATTDDYRVHLAVDYLPSVRDKGVYAIAGGRIVEVGDNSTNGKYVIIQNTFGYKYCYCSLGEILVSVGDVVVTGDKLGTVGNTIPLEASADAHVHLVAEAPDGKAINPITEAVVVGDA